ncbi:MAG: hypothetical protein JW963_14695 [Anaerolineales bacterium]|nr:hypothetical protein [Anaerolineales bacterium]
MAHPDKKIHAATPTIAKSVTAILYGSAILVYMTWLVFRLIEGGQWPVLFPSLQPIFSIIVSIAFALFMFVFSFRFIAISTNNTLKARRLSEEGQETTGLISLAWQVEQRTNFIKTGYRYYVQFEYQIFGVQYKLVQEISKKESVNYLPGKNVRVKYEPTSPLNARMLGLEKSGL